MPRRKKNGLKPSLPMGYEDLNYATFLDYYRRLTRLALLRFEWENLPESMDARYLEWSLFLHGCAAFLYDPERGYINTNTNYAGRLNIYQLPVSINCYAIDFNQNRKVYYDRIVDTNGNDLTDKNSVAILVKNNFDRIPTMDTIILFAARLAAAERVIDTNLAAQRTPVMILTDERQRLTMENLFKQVENDAPVIMGDKNILDVSKIKTLNLDAPYVVDRVTMYKRNIWNEALTFLGVDNLEEKRERLVADEVGQNNEQVNLNMDSFLTPRQEAVKQFNELFGLNISVRTRSDLQNIKKLTDALSAPDVDEMVKEEVINE